MIECTKSRKRPEDPLLRIFWDADNSLFQKSFKLFLENEKKIKTEFGYLSSQTYKKGRIKFLKSCLGTMGVKADKNINNLLQFIEKNY
jgi:predicted metal-dependent HD superfamily phosphohydrolase